MQLTRRSIASLAFLALASCTEDPIAPAGTLIGRWGGAGAELTGSTSGSTLNLGCGPMSSAQTVRLDIEGQITLQYPAPFGGTTHAFGSVDGAGGDVITLNVTPAGTTQTRQFVLRRGEQASFTIACALTGS